MLKSTKNMLESKAWKESGLECISEDENNTSKAYVRDKYGVCLVWKDKLNSNIRNAIDKTEYMINKFKEIHCDEYNYCELLLPKGEAS